jgi:hypothetical protein
VYEATETATGRRVAVKALKPSALADREARQAFAAEAEALSRASACAFVIRTYGAGEADGWPYVAMELMEGGSLADRMRGGRGDPGFAARAFGNVALALDAARGFGWVHGDVKPANVLLRAKGDASTARLADFSLARAEGAALGGLGGSWAAGTPAYAAPEAFEGKGPSAATDAWSFGASLFHAATGIPPFLADGRGTLAWREAVRSGLRDEARRALETLPEAVARVVRACLAPEPEMRRVDFGAMAVELGARVDVNVDAEGREAWEDRGDSLLRAGVSAFAEGRLDEAMRSYAEADERYSEGRSSRSRAMVAVRRGELAERKGDMRAAEDEYREAVALSELAAANGEQSEASRAEALKRLGNAAFYSRDAAKALELYRLAAEAAIAARDASLETQCLYNMGGPLMAAGRIDEAKAAFELAFERAAARGFIRQMAYASAGKARVLVAEGRYRAAAKALGRAIEYARRSGDRVAEASCRTNLGVTFRRLGRRASAAAAFREAERAMGALGDEVGRCMAMANLAECAIESGDSQAARAWRDGALAIAGNPGASPRLAAAEVACADVSISLGELEAADATLEALSGARAQGFDPELAANAAVARSRLAIARFGAGSREADEASREAMEKAGLARFAQAACAARLARSAALAARGDLEGALAAAEAACALAARQAGCLTGAAREARKNAQCALEGARRGGRSRGEGAL